MTARLLALMLVLSACGAAPPPPADRADVALDRRIADLASDELETLVGGTGVERARVVVVDPRDGRVVFAAARGRDGVLDRELPASEVRSHGSTGKTLALAAMIAHGTPSLEETLDGEPFDEGGRRVVDHALHGPMTLGDALAFSSNVGFARAALRLGAPALFETIGALGLAHRIPDGAGEHEAVELAIGEGLRLTSVEVASAYATIAAGGIRHAPWTIGGEPTPAERVLPESVATSVIAMLEATVTRDDATGTGARVAGVRVAGKTGTVSDEGTTFGVFVGMFPVETPRWVALVGVEAHGEGYSGGTLAAPAFARLATAISASE